jgi:hypothetical protein
MLPLWYEEAAALASSPPQQKQPSSSPGVQIPIDNSPSRNTSSSPSVTTTSTGTSGQPQPRLGNSHDLALLFMIFCFGSLTDVNLPSPPDNIPAERFYQLTKVSLTLDPQAGASEFRFLFFYLFFFFFFLGGAVIKIKIYVHYTSNPHRCQVTP